MSSRSAQQFTGCSGPVYVLAPILQHLLHQLIQLRFPAHNETGKNVTQSMARILLAEDDNDLRRFLVKALERAGHKVTAFGEGASAFEEIKQATFDLLLTDIVMPEMDGIELARRAAELDPALKIMFITGFAAVALNPDSQAPKEAKVLSKPFHLRDLVDEVNRLMAA
jgi:two-component system, cell cycle response regulator CpdR